MRKKIEVFGTGCKKCVLTEEMIKNKAQEIGADIELTHIYDPVEIATRGIMSTPAVMIDGRLVHKGGLPDQSDIECWLK
ncbi:MAG: thioredoxin family protein [Pseudomonadota bacterium]|jgi:small redox-active disulfide protein 2|nr:thioredoxin family protein [Pseudomonadota bacterium]QKK04421.1 MAG: thioredoxin family protein [Pseudomonadota bacterium]|tara:strand:- start:846 stop:1082 length:237 start_codon:yes stop_codon:yes gene_type:complete